MARPLKTGLSYFPLDCVLDEKFRSIEAVFKNDGFVWTVKFWQLAYQQPDGCVDFDGIYGVIHPENSRITPGKHLEILSFALKIGLIFKNSHGLYTSTGIQKRISTINKERENDRNRHGNEFSAGKPPGKPPEKGGKGKGNIKGNKEEEDKKIRPDKPADPRFKEFVGVFFSGYEKSFGVKYANQGRDFKTLKLFLEDNAEINIDRFGVACAKCYDDEKFHRKNMSIAYICNHFSILENLK
jgi:hypothetical protein